ncbi:MAG: hypothetical protein WD231_05345 [Candidatus Woykebacteria bacterium]
MNTLLRWPFPAIFFILALIVVFWLNKTPPSVSVQSGPSQKMTEEQAETFVENEMLKCSKQFNPAGCTEQASKLFLSQMSYDQLLKALKTATKTPSVYEICHPLVHFIGRSSYTLEHDMDKLFAADRSVCDSGFYHGVIEQNLEEKGTIVFQDNQVKSFEGVKDLCGKIEDYSIPLRYSSCVHGLGHGLMYVTDNDLMISLKGCDTTPGPGTCYGGVFMENGGSATNPYHYSKYLRADDLLYPCNSLEEKYLVACYRYQSLYYARLTSRDWPKTLDLCLKVPKEYQGTCIQFVGSNLINYSEDINLMKSVYAKVPEAYQGYFITGLVSGLGEDNVGVPSKMKAVCDFVSGSSLETSCYKDIGVAIRRWSFDLQERQHFCEEALARSAFENCAYASIPNFDPFFYRVFSGIKELTNFRLDYY